MSNFADKLKTGLATAAKVGTAAIGAATAAVGALTKASIEGYGSYEQLVGGIETLFGAGGQSLEEYAQSVGKTTDEAAEKYRELMEVQEAALQNANNAYRTAGLSANDYMETITGFAASLKQSLGEEYSSQMASYADMAISDMADNANKMGTAMDSIQNAYQGFAKQNYTMLDNLKLGYGGTKEEMERLLHDAEALEGYMEGSLDVSNFSDIVEAIHIVQENMGITGTTAKEAASTIQGSTASMKAAWQNLVVGIADENADLSGLISNFTESVATAAGNILPRIQQILIGISNAVGEFAPIISQAVPKVIAEVLPQMVSAGIQLVEAVGTGIMDSVPTVIDAAIEIVGTLASGISGSLPDLIPAVVDTILYIVDALIDNADELVDAALEIILSLADGLIDALPRLLEKVPVIVEKLVTVLANNLPKITQAGVELVIKLALGIANALPKIIAMGPQIINSFVSGAVQYFGNLLSLGSNMVGRVGDGIRNIIYSARTWGRDLVSGFADGILSAIHLVTDAASSVANKVKRLLHFSRPDEGPLRDYETWMPDFMAGLAAGIDANAWRVQDALKDATASMAELSAPAVGTFSGSYGGAAVSGQQVPAGAGNIGGITININGIQFNTMEELARTLSSEVQYAVERSLNAFGSPAPA